MTRVAHLVVGPEEHGVVRHAAAVARACGHDLYRARDADAARRIDLRGYDVVHIPFTDRLFARTAEDAAAQFAAVVTPLRAAVSVTLHDLPHGAAAVQVRRRICYDTVLSFARGVVVSSWHELGLVGPHSARATAVIRLPVDAVEADVPHRFRYDVGVLGFLYPDRGYEHTLDELPAGRTLVAVGRPADGHDDLVVALHDRADGALSITGFVPDDDLAAVLAAVAVPVAPNRRVSASASICTWLAHGRRPLVPIGPYTRELDDAFPGTLMLYDADVPGALRTEVERALAEPSRTRPEPGGARGPALVDVARQYARHLLGCAVASVRTVGGARVLPDNRWDLLEDIAPPALPAVSVVVTHYEAQAQLDLVLRALSLQTHPHAALQVVVADDGSRHAPDLAQAGDLDARLVRQEDLGFRAAAARNLGARAADGEVLLFLDGDTVPTPDYVAALGRLPALAPDCVVAGRRRHADLAGWTPDRVERWLLGDGPGPVELEEPGWLVDGLRNRLLDADRRSYRYLISAVLGVSRALFEEVGGFADTITGYGGEDWELANRLWHGGAVFAHVPTAQAWHDGPDWAARAPEKRPAQKNAETLTLARLLPDPDLRGPGSWFPYPGLVVTMDGADPAAVLLTARALFASDADCALWLTDGDRTVAALGDPRIHAGPVPDDVLARARARLDVERPCSQVDLQALLESADRYGEVRTPVGMLRTTRATARARRWGTSIEHLFPVGACHRAQPTAGVELASALPRVGRPQA